MSADTEIAKIDNGIVVPINEKRLPLYLQRVNDFEGWLINRAVDRHRANSRLLKKALGLTLAEETEVVLKVHAATITDHYWFRASGSYLTYDEVKFKDNIFDKLALYGDPDSFNYPESTTPELTNIGSYEKCWRIVDGKWWIYKQGSENERFSELFISYFGQALGFSMAHYELESSYIKTLDFTNQQVDYEAIYSLAGDDEDYQKSFEILENLCPAAVKDYVNMIFLDTICFNMDRHTKNYGVLRDINTGDVRGLAPNFDNNIALISRGYPNNIERNKDRMIELFVKFVSENHRARFIYEKIDTSIITEKTIKACIEKTKFIVDAERICAFILNGVKQIVELVGDK